MVSRAAPLYQFLGYDIEVSLFFFLFLSRDAICVSVQIAAQFVSHTKTYSFITLPAPARSHSRMNVSPRSPWPLYARRGFLRETNCQPGLTWPVWNMRDPYEGTSWMEKQHKALWTTPRWYTRCDSFREISSSVRFLKKTRRTLIQIERDGLFFFLFQHYVYSPSDDVCTTRTKLNPKSYVRALQSARTRAARWFVPNIAFFFQILFNSRKKKNGMRGVCDSCVWDKIDLLVLIVR